MDGLKDCLTEYRVYLGGVAVIGVTLVLLRRHWRKTERVCGVDYPRDTVVVHQSQRGPYAPSLGHFVMKLETYLRIAKIPYIPQTSNVKNSPKHKVPWIEYNGKVMGDSQFCIEFLNKEFNVDLNAGLSDEQKAHAHALRKMVEDFTYWLCIYSRWALHVDDMVEMCKFPKPWLTKWMASRFMRNIANAQGVGRHSKQEVEALFEDDLRALSDFLGDKKFFMGNDVTEVDCAVFGQLSQIKWHIPDSCQAKHLLKERYTNLDDFCVRIKTLYWPDWDSCFTAGILADTS